MTDDDGQKRDERGKFKPGNSFGRRFQPGQVANPQGRNSYGGLVTDNLRNKLLELIPNADGKTIAAAIADKLVELALDGDLPAIKELLDRTEGRAKQHLEMDVAVTDWRQIVAANGISKDELENEIKLILSEPDGGEPH